MTSSKVDYFNTVTDQVRKQQVATPEEPPVTTAGIWPIALGLAAVIFLGGFGIWRAYAPASAEELYTAIELNVDEPDRVLEEIDSFLTNYPEEPRAPQVAELQRIGKAIELYNSLWNTLTVRKNLPGESRLTELENSFLNIVELADSDADSAKRKMQAFVITHDHPDLNERDRKCVEAAKAYRIKIDNDARGRVLFNLKQIRVAMNKAARTTDPKGGIPIYESIIELYGDIDWGNLEEADEGRELVQKARDILKSMKAALKKANQAKEDE